MFITTCYLANKRMPLENGQKGSYGQKTDNGEWAPVMQVPNAVGSLWSDLVLSLSSVKCRLELEVDQECFSRGFQVVNDQGKWLDISLDLNASKDGGLNCLLEQHSTLTKDGK